MKGQGVSLAKPESLGIAALQSSDIVVGSMGNPIDLSNTGKKPVLVWFQEVVCPTKRVVVESCRQIASGATIRFGIDSTNFLRLSLKPFSGITAVRGGKLSANALRESQQAAGLRPR
jgi:hypothetical protein